MTKFFKKSKKPYLGTILSPFSSNLCKMNFPEKRVLSVSRYSNYLPSCQKSVKDYRAISNKNAKLRDGQTDNSDFLGPATGRGSNTQVHQSLHQ